MIEKVNLVAPAKIQGHHDGLSATVLSASRGYELTEAQHGVFVTWMRDGKAHRTLIPMSNVSAIHYAPEAKAAPVPVKK